MTQKEQFRPVIEKVLTKLRLLQPQWHCTANYFSRKPKYEFDVVITEISSGKEFVESFNKSEINSFLKLPTASAVESLTQTFEDIAKKKFNTI